MARKVKKTKPLIYVFCEGESEQAYTDFLKKTFQNVAVIKRPSATGLFEEADAKLKKDIKYINNAEVTDEIWFFYDVEKKDADCWKERYDIIKTLRKLRKKPGIRVRLLMTTGCLECWLMLHYKFFMPQVLSVAEKENMLHEVKKREPNYEKGDYDTTAKIAEAYPTAVENAKRTIEMIFERHT